jgi:hypothetical protein
MIRSMSPADFLVGNAAARHDGVRGDGERRLGRV